MFALLLLLVVGIRNEPIHCDVFELNVCTVNVIEPPLIQLLAIKDGRLLIVDGQVVVFPVDWVTNDYVGLRILDEGYQITVSGKRVVSPKFRVEFTSHDRAFELSKK